MRSAFRCRRRGIGCRGASASGLPTSAGHGDRAEPPDSRGTPTPARPGGIRRAAPCRASFIPGAASGAPGSRASRPTGAAPGGRWPAGRSGAAGDRPVGVFRGPFPRCVGRGPAIGAGAAAGPVRAAQSGTGLPAADPRGAAGARRSWSGRSPRGGLCGGPVVGPERQTPGELPARAHGCAGRSSAQRPSIRRQANRYRVGAPLPSGLVPSLDGRAYGPGSRVVAADRRGWHPPSSSPPASTPTAPSTARRWKSGWATASATTWLNVET
jgi:hypothetical protein